MIYVNSAGASRVISLLRPGSGALNVCRVPKSGRAALTSRSSLGRQLTTSRDGAEQMAATTLTVCAPKSNNWNRQRRIHFNKIALIASGNIHTPRTPFLVSWSICHHGNLARRVPGDSGFEASRSICGTGVKITAAQQTGAPPIRQPHIGYLRKLINSKWAPGCAGIWLAMCKT